MAPVIETLMTSRVLLHHGRSRHGLLKKMPLPPGLLAITL
jgi:hypothetical protein